MPFVRGRYHINPVLGEALEAAREAEADLLALEQEEDGKEPAEQKAPVHRVEIEAAELVPSHSGRGQRGYVARVHRQPAAAASTEGDDLLGEAHGSYPNGSYPNHAGAPTKRGKAAAQPETHVFANHGDLASFLQDELGNSDGD